MARKTKAQKAAEARAAKAAKSATATQAPDAPTAVLDEKTVAKEVLYSIGITKMAPVHNITIPTLNGGICVTFPCHTSEIVKDGRNLALAAPRPGGKIRLYSDEVEALKKNIAKRFVNWANKETRMGDVMKRVDTVKDGVAMRQANRELHGGDEPLSKFIWLIPVDDLSTLSAMGSEQPPTLYEMEHGPESSEEE